MTKNGHQNFWDIEDFFGEMQEFFQETPKKGDEKFASPVSEVLDPLVNGMECILQSKLI